MLAAHVDLRRTSFRVRIAEQNPHAILPDVHGTRAACGATEKFWTDPYWREHMLFYEHVHGDNGAGLSASIRPAGPG